jgi:hypothetical protein
MPQVFHPSTNTISRVSVFGAVGLVFGAAGVGAMIVRSPYVTGVGVIRSQPIPFSHQHHVGEAGIDCRYCHRGAERDASAGLPSTEDCLGCHSQLWADSEMLQPIRTSWDTGRPIAWVRVHDVPDFVYFHHGIHVSHGVACETCHGRMDRMPLTWRNATLHMEWCLECHRDPEPHRRPANAVLAMGWKRSDDPSSDKEPATVPRVSARTDCSACHR